MTGQTSHLSPTRDASPIQVTLYNGYGLIVRSEVPLPLASAGAPHASVDVTIRVQSGPAPEIEAPLVAWMPCEIHGVDMRVYRGPLGTWIWRREVATFAISPDLRQVDVWRTPEATDDRALGLALIGPVLLFLMLMRGMPPLHASAVMVDERAIAFLGVQGQGKSTMAAAFLRHGARILTDDALPFYASPADGTLIARPGPPHMKLWEATASHTLGITEVLPNLHDTSEKKLLSLDALSTIGAGEVPLAAIYLLERFDPAAVNCADISIRPLTARQAVTHLLTHTVSRSYLLPPEEVPLLQFYAQVVKRIPVRAVAYPSGFAHQQAVYAAILEDVRQQGEEPV